jgi:hypothetical protein
LDAGRVGRRIGRKLAKPDGIVDSREDVDSDDVVPAAAYVDEARDSLSAAGSAADADAHAGEVR